MNRILVIGGAGTVGRQGRMRFNGDPVIYIRHGICSSSAPFVPFGEVSCGDVSELDLR